MKRTLTLLLCLLLAVPVLGADLTGSAVNTWYKDLVQLPNSNAGIDATLRQLQSGNGALWPLWMSTTSAELFNGVLSWDWTDATVGKTVWEVKTNNTTRGPFRLVFVDSTSGFHDPVWHLGYNVKPGFEREHTADNQGSLAMTFEGDYTGLGEWHIQGLDTSNVNHRMFSTALNYVTGTSSNSIYGTQTVIGDSVTNTPILQFSSAGSVGTPWTASMTWNHGSFYVGSYGLAMSFMKNDTTFQSGMGFDWRNTFGYDWFVLGYSHFEAANNGTFSKAYIAGLWNVYGTSQTNNLKLVTVSTPAAPTITQGGTPGSTNYSYAVVGKSADGTVTSIGTATQTTTGAATLNATDYNTITWAAATNAVRYDVYRTASSGTPASTGKLFSDVQSPQNDVGGAASGTAPTANATGYLAITLGAAVTSAATIAPTGPLFHVTAANEITTITLPYTGFVGSIQLIPDATFTTATGGNIALASTAVVGKVLTMTFDGTSWYPSY